VKEKRLARRIDREERHGIKGGQARDDEDMAARLGESGQQALGNAHGRLDVNLDRATLGLERDEVKEAVAAYPHIIDEKPDLASLSLRCIEQPALLVLPRQIGLDRYGGNAIAGLQVSGESGKSLARQSDEN
jgi:hypothetical protein